MVSSSAVDATEAARLRQRSAMLVRERVRTGIENEGQAHQATAELSQARAELISAYAAIARTRHQLAALLGKGPDRGLAIELPETPQMRSIGLPDRVELDLIGKLKSLALTDGDPFSKFLQDEKICPMTPP